MFLDIWEGFPDQNVWIMYPVLDQKGLVNKWWSSPFPGLKELCQEILQIQSLVPKRLYNTAIVINEGTDGRNWRKLKRIAIKIFENFWA